MSANVCELACGILRATKDGEELAPPDLKLVELAVNGCLNEAGKAAFMELHRNATKPAGYTVPWFLGIEHMTRDHQRHIYWKGARIEHYDHDFWQQNGWRECMKADAEALAARCLALEAQGITPTWQNVMS
ncbi:MAG TPA: hypothetical protein VFK06_22000 [Candidatus Angelobacter sp.]|nr:hypothetical protein [Candidatus Angelobacter sp.]